MLYKLDSAYIVQGRAVTELKFARGNGWSFTISHNSHSKLGTMGKWFSFSHWSAFITYRIASISTSTSTQIIIPTRFLSLLLVVLNVNRGFIPIHRSFFYFFSPPANFKRVRVWSYSGLSSGHLPSFSLTLRNRPVPEILCKCFYQLCLYLTSFWPHSISRNGFYPQDSDFSFFLRS